MYKGTKFTPSWPEFSMKMSHARYVDVYIHGHLYAKPCDYSCLLMMQAVVAKRDQKWGAVLLGRVVLLRDKMVCLLGCTLS